MKLFRPRFLIVLLVALLASTSAWAHRSHGHRHGHRQAHVGVVIGMPLMAPWHYRTPDYYIYPPVIASPSPPVYIEQNAEPPAGEQQSNYWWYYCQGAQAYYPYVMECPQGWQLVAPRPPDLR